MRLLYATSIMLPSPYANRRQILAMAKAFHAQLGNDFLLGVAANKGADTEHVPITEIGSVRSPILAWRYTLLVQKHSFNRVYTREDHLFFFLHIFLSLFGVPSRIFFEAHTFPTEGVSAFLFRYAVRNAAGVVAITHGLRDDIGTLGVPKERIHVASDAADMELFGASVPVQSVRADLAIPANKKVIAYIGRYTTQGKEKGVKEVIEAFRVAQRKIPMLHLLIVGLRPHEEALVEKVCDDLGIIADNRTLLSYVSQSLVARYMQAADVLVMNYPRSKHYERYMSPMKLFEYMAAGRPIVTSDLPSVREILSEENAILVAPDDVGALAEGIRRACSDNILAERIARQARQDVEAKYTWGKRAQDIMDFMI